MAKKKGKFIKRYYFAEGLGMGSRAIIQASDMEMAKRIAARNMGEFMDNVRLESLSDIPEHLKSRKKMYGVLSQSW